MHSQEFYVCFILHAPTTYKIMYFFFGCPYKQKNILIKNQDESVMFFVNFKHRKTK